MYEALFLLVVVTVTGTNHFFDIVKPRQQKESGTTSTTPSPPNSTPAATASTSSSTGSAKPKPQARAKKRTLAFATPSPIPKKSPKPKQTASPELLAKWLRQFPWLRFDEQRGLYCFFWVGVGIWWHVVFWIAYGGFAMDLKILTMDLRRIIRRYRDDWLSVCSLPITTINPLLRVLYFTCL